MTAIKYLNWSEPRPPTKSIPACYYDNVYADTPFGRIWIEWKSWKEHDSFDVRTDWEFYAIGNDLADAKRIAQKDFDERILSQVEDCR